MELFTYLRMGGAMSQVEVNMLTNPDKKRAEAQQELKAKFASFDAAKSQCASDEDRQRLLAIIEASHGNFTDFNATVSGLFEERLTSTALKSETKKPLERSAGSGASSGSVMSIYSCQI